MLPSNESIDSELENKINSNILSSDDESRESDDDSHEFDNALDYQHDVVDNKIYQMHTSKSTRVFKPNLIIPSKHLLNKRFKKKSSSTQTH